MRRDHTAEVLAETTHDQPLPVRGKRKWVTRPEDAIQVQCIRWLRSQPAMRWIVAQPERLNPPPHRRDFLKALGILGNAGAPELLIFDGRKIIPRMIACELKAPDGRMSPEQIGWQTFCIACGIEHAIVRSVEDLQRALG